MNVFEHISQIDKKFAWSFLGVLIAIFGLWYFRDNPASLQVDLVSKARVYDVHADVPGLAIQFEGENIREKKQVLSFFTVRMSNPGGKPITQEMFDKNLLFGLELSNGRAFPPELVEASQQYLRDNLRPTLAASNRIELGKVVVDAGAHFAIRFLVLHLESLEPKVIPIGKIAGTSFEGVPIVVPLETKATRSFWSEVIYGSPGIHVMRFVGYITAIIALGFGIGGPLALIDSWRTKRKTKKVAQKFCAYQGGRDTTHAILLAKIASQYGDKGLTLCARLGELNLTEQTLGRLYRRVEFSDHPEFYDHPFLFAHYIISSLMEAKGLHTVDGRLVPTKSLQESIEDFRAFWRSTEPADIEASNRFVERIIGRLKQNVQPFATENIGDNVLTSEVKS